MTDEARAADSPPRPTVHIPNPTYLYVIFDGPPAHQSGRFVEVEDENGQGVSAGNWEERGDGFWTLGPFLQPPAETAEQPDIVGEVIPLPVRVARCVGNRWGLVGADGGVYMDSPNERMVRYLCAAVNQAFPATEQPATDLGAMVEAILAEATFPEFRKADRMELSVKLAAIHGTAKRLKTALTQREGESEDMALALEAEEAVGVHFAKCSYELSGCETPTEDDGQELFCKEYRRLAEVAGAMRCGALGQYKEARRG